MKVACLLPILKLKNPGETRVGSTICLFQSAMINHFAFSLLDLQSTEETKFKKLWESLNDGNTWKVLCMVFIVLFMFAHVIHPFLTLHTCI